MSSAGLGIDGDVRVAAGPRRPIAVVLEASAFALVLRRDEAIEAGWFGPKVADQVRDRIGDVVVAALGNLVVTRSKVEPRLSRMVGQHGSLTPSEQLIPLLPYTT